MILLSSSALSPQDSFCNAVFLFFLMLLLDAPESQSFLIVNLFLVLVQTDELPSFFPSIFIMEIYP